MCSLFVKHLGDTQVGERRKAILRVTSRFIEPVDVAVEVEDPDRFFLEVEPSRFRLGPGESRELEIYLYPRRYDVVGYDTRLRIVFKASTPVTTEYREARVIMNIYLIDLYEVIIAPAHQVAESEVTSTFTSETRIYKIFSPRPPYQVTLPIASAAEAAETEHVTVAIPPPLAEAPDVPLLVVIRHTTTSTPPDTTLARAIDSLEISTPADTTLVQIINNPELTYS